MKEVRLWIEDFGGYIYIFTQPNNRYKKKLQEQKKPTQNKREIHGRSPEFFFLVSL